MLCLAGQRLGLQETAAGYQYEPDAQHDNVQRVNIPHHYYLDHNPAAQQYPLQEHGNLLPRRFANHHNGSGNVQEPVSSK